MRKIVAMFVVAGLIMSTVAPLVAQQQSAPKHDKKPAVQQATESYVCPMHPDEKAAKPGKCSKCGMALEKKVEKPAQVIKKGSKKHEGKEKCGGCQEACDDK